MAETLHVERVGERTLTALWEKDGHRDRRVLFPLDTVEPDDREHLAVGVELYWSFARPGDERLAVRHATPPTMEQFTRWREAGLARIAASERAAEDRAHRLRSASPAS